MISVGGHGWSVGLAPDLGGSILHARYDGRDVLRAATDGCDDPLAAACFPLVPYANRIADGRFAFAGRTYHLPRNFGDHPHSLHGTGWRAAWSVAAQNDGVAILRHDHVPDAHWPWRFVAEQTIAAGPAGLDIGLTLTNADDTPMPGGLGLHPYFPIRADTRLAFAAEGAWRTGPTLLPIERMAADHFGDWSAGALVARDDLIDTVWDGWTGSATIDDTTIASGARAMHLYIPPRAAFLCVEPVTHLPDAINRDGMVVLSPGETMRIDMRIARTGPSA